MSRWKKITERHAEQIINSAEDDGIKIKFLVPPACQGQIVEHAYAGCGEAGIIERITDRADRSVSYRVREWRDSDETAPGLNHKPG